MRTWIWLSIPLAPLFFCSWASVPLWLTLTRWNTELNAKHAEIAAKAGLAPIFAQPAACPSPGIAAWAHRLAPCRYAGLHQIGRARWRVTGPQPVNQVPRQHPGVAPQHQHGQHPAPLRPGRSQRTAALHHLERAQDTELQPVTHLLPAPHDGPEPARHRAPGDRRTRPRDQCQASLAHRRRAPDRRGTTLETPPGAGCSGSTPARTATCPHPPSCGHPPGNWPAPRSSATSPSPTSREGPACGDAYWLARTNWPSR